MKNLLLLFFEALEMMYEDKARPSSGAGQDRAGLQQQSEKDLKKIVPVAVEYFLSWVKDEFPALMPHIVQVSIIPEENYALITLFNEGLPTLLPNEFAVRDAVKRMLGCSQVGFATEDDLLGDPLPNPMKEEQGNFMEDLHQLAKTMRQLMGQTHREEEEESCISLGEMLEELPPDLLAVRLPLSVVEPLIDAIYFEMAKDCARSDKDRILKRISQQ